MFPHGHLVVMLLWFSCFGQTLRNASFSECSLSITLYISEGALAFMLSFEIHNNPVRVFVTLVISCINRGWEKVHDYFNITQMQIVKAGLEPMSPDSQQSTLSLHDKLHPNKTFAQWVNLRPISPWLWVNVLIISMLTPPYHQHAHTPSCLPQLESSESGCLV